MKKKLYFVIFLLILCFLVGGLYISKSINEVTGKLETIITLHQVEILRKNLLTDVKAVQQDLLLKDSPHATKVDTFIQHGEKMFDEVEGCEPESNNEGNQADSQGENGNRTIGGQGERPAKWAVDG